MSATTRNAATTSAVFAEGALAPVVERPAFSEVHAAGADGHVGVHPVLGALDVEPAAAFLGDAVLFKEGVRGRDADRGHGEAVPFTGNACRDASTAIEPDGCRS